MFSNLTSDNNETKSTKSTKSSRKSLRMKVDERDTSSTNPLPTSVIVVYIFCIVDSSRLET
jgi:hypothetical protein